MLCSWCCRQSIDLYSSVPSPNIGFLGTSSFSRLSSSFLSTSLTRRHTPEALPSVTKPLIQQQIEDAPQQRRSSHTLLTPSARRSSMLKKDSKVSHEVPSRHCSFGQSVLNGNEFIEPRLARALLVQILFNLRYLDLRICAFMDFGLNCRHKCSLWSWNPFDPLCCERRWMGRTFHLVHFRNSFLLYRIALAFLLGQWAWSWDISGHWPSCFWYCRTYCHFSKSIFMFIFMISSLVVAVVSNLNFLWFLLFCGCR